MTNNIITIGGSKKDQNLYLQLSHFGFSLVQLDNDLNIDGCGKIKPKVILFNADNHPLSTLEKIQNKFPELIPTIVFSKEFSVEQHLEAINYGCFHLTQDYNLSSLVEKIDELSLDNNPEPFKVLIIEDSESMSVYYSSLLEGKGMCTATTCNPLEALEKINTFSPDLILTDMYMPECSGLELVKIIRQRETYLSIPIIFLSSESDIEIQISTMAYGIDDFLNKKISSEHLVKIISARIERSRKLRSLMHKDSLTGLLNHSTLLTRLDAEISRAQRTSTYLVYAMIDIDHFKSVNDTYGHSVGDTVIKSLSRLLQQRLRKSDIIGRYGGEEFAVIMPDTSLDAAYDVIEKLRSSFASVNQMSDKGDFNVTFSCGLSSSIDFHSSLDICDEADKALYVAKESGRNQTITAKLK